MYWIEGDKFHFLHIGFAIFSQELFIMLSKYLGYFNKLGNAVYDIVSSSLF